MHERGRIWDTTAPQTCKNTLLLAFEFKLERVFKAFWLCIKTSTADFARDQHSFGKRQQLFCTY